MNKLLSTILLLPLYPILLNPVFILLYYLYTNFYYPTPHIKVTTYFHKKTRTKVGPYIKSDGTFVRSYIRRTNPIHKTVEYYIEK